MNTVYENIEAEIPKLRDEAALAMKEVEWEKLAAGIEKKMADSVKIINNVISSLVQAEIRTQDWQQISDELKKASDQLTAELNQKQFT